MSIQTELNRIINAKAAIKTAIEGKGVTVPDGTLLDGMAALIESIEAGGGGSNIVIGEITIATDNVSFGLEIPKPDGYENRTVPVFAVAINKTKTEINSSDYGNGQRTCRTSAIIATRNGVGIRQSSNGTGTGSGVFDNPSEVCMWYGVKLWFYLSVDINYKSARAGDTYLYAYIL